MNLKNLIVSGALLAIAIMVACWKVVELALSPDRATWISFAIFVVFSWPAYLLLITTVVKELTLLDLHRWMRVYHPNGRNLGVPRA